MPIRTWIDEADDHELEGVWGILERLAIVNNIPKVLGEIKRRNWIVNANNLNKVMEKAVFHDCRGDFNSPMNGNAKKFEF